MNPMPYGSADIEALCTISCSASAVLFSNTELRLIFGEVKQQMNNV